MPQGMQVWDASGNLILDVTQFLGRILAIVDIPASSSGTISVPNPGSTYGTRWSLVQAMSTSFVPTAANGTPTGPTWSISGTTLTYSNTYAYAFKIIIGIA
jgi:hypothetical protein